MTMALGRLLTFAQTGLLSWLVWASGPWGKAWRLGHLVGPKK